MGLQKDRNETIDVLFGILSIGIVYLHSSYAGGFSINDFGLNSHILRQLTGLLYMTFVPMFFIAYGYLSYDSLFSAEDNWTFLKRKTFQFLPIYVFFLGISAFRNFDFWSHLSLWKIMLGCVGLYYEPGITSGQILFVVNMTILTRILFKVLKVRDNFLFFYLVALSFTLNYLVPRPAEFYILTFSGYYLAVIFGMNLKRLNMLEGQITHNMSIVVCMIITALVVPILNFNGIYALEINYSPNSIEQIIFSGTILVLGYFGLKKITPHLPRFLIAFFIEIGKKSYAHFIIHIHIIALIIYVGNTFNLPDVLVQCVILGTVSYISIYIVYPLWFRVMNYTQS